MKNIKEFINEENNKYTYDLTHDVYGALSDVAFNYEMTHKGKLFNKKDLKKAFEWFLDKFFEE
jgi:hypothetical protein